MIEISTFIHLNDRHLSTDEIKAVGMHQIVTHSFKQTNYVLKRLI